jgi:subtilase family serine protease
MVNDGPVDTLYVFNYRVILSANETLGDNDDNVILDVEYGYIVEANQNYLFYDEIIIPDDLANGEYFVGMELDYTNNIDESDENDNSRIDADKLVVNGPSVVDLAPASVIADENDVSVGLNTTFSFDVDNLGPDPVGPFSTKLYYSTDQTITAGDTLICTTNQAGVAANSTINVQAQCAVPNLSGNRYFGVIVDAANAIDETNENNNVGHDASIVAIGALDVDLATTAVSTSSHSVDVGDLVNVSAMVTNQGPDASPAFTIAYYYSTDVNITVADKKICEANGPALAAGQSANVATNCAVPLVATGNYRLGAIADPNGVLVESDETNNDGLDPSSVSVTAPNVDLAYELHWDNLPNIANGGQNVNYHLQVWNLGNDALPAGSDVTMRWSSDMNITLADAEGCTVDIGAIQAGALVEFQYDCATPDLVGFYYSGVILDPANTIPETNENNNKASSPNFQQFQ